jgi:hypothetical protein
MDSVLAPDPGPIARLAAVISQEHTPSVVFQRLTEGETLRQIARSWQVPVGRFTQWFSTQHAELYDAALKVRADTIAHEALAISDEQALAHSKQGIPFDPDVSRDKLRVDTRLRLSGKWDRDRYGDKTDVRHTGLVPTLIIEIATPEPERRVIDVSPAVPDASDGLI